MNDLLSKQWPEEINLDILEKSSKKDLQIKGKKWVQLKPILQRAISQHHLDVLSPCTICGVSFPTLFHFAVAKESEALIDLFFDSISVQDATQFINDCNNNNHPMISPLFYLYNFRQLLQPLMSHGFSIRVTNPATGQTLVHVLFERMAARCSAHLVKSVSKILMILPAEDMMIQDNNQSYPLQILLKRCKRSLGKNWLNLYDIVTQHMDQKTILRALLTGCLCRNFPELYTKVNWHKYVEYIWEDKKTLLHLANPDNKHWVLSLGQNPWLMDSEGQLGFDLENDIISNDHFSIKGKRPALNLNSTSQEILQPDAVLTPICNIPYEVWAVIFRWLDMYSIEVFCCKTCSSLRKYFQSKQSERLWNLLLESFGYTTTRRTRPNGWTRISNTVQNQNDELSISEQSTSTENSNQTCFSEEKNLETSCSVQIEPELKSDTLYRGIWETSAEAHMRWLFHKPKSYKQLSFSQLRKCTDEHLVYGSRQFVCVARLPDLTLVSKIDVAMFSGDKSSDVHFTTGCRGQQKVIISHATNQIIPFRAFGKLHGTTHVHTPYVIDHEWRGNLTLYQLGEAGVEHEYSFPKAKKLLFPGPKDIVLAMNKNNSIEVHDLRASEVQATFESPYDSQPEAISCHDNKVAFVNTHEDITFDLFDLRKFSSFHPLFSIRAPIPANPNFIQSTSFLWMDKTKALIETGDRTLTFDLMTSTWAGIGTRQIIGANSFMMIDRDAKIFNFEH